ncbi:MAG: twin-arginine translocase subunit TatC [Bacteroidales bacterium]|nr:twin-arginine translocase subunit TatC [Bacteroidales bacterium]
MTFWDHLDVLRRSIVRCVVVLVAAAIGLFAFKDFLFDGLILAPSKGDFFLYKWIGADFSLNLVNLEVTAQFMIHMKMAFLCALVLTFPYLIYKVWDFIAPALYDNERRAVRKAFVFASCLFYTGVVVGYTLIFPLMLNFFADYQVSTSIPNTFSLSSYISLLTSMVLTFGIVFEFPTVAALLSNLGILTKETMTKYRRHAICAVVILAAAITPSGDPFSLAVVAVPLYLLYEFSVFICKSGKTQEVEN